MSMWKSGLLITGILFILFLLTIPVLLKEQIPCLKMITGISYSWETCHVTLILDRFMLLALTGYGVFVIILAGFLLQPVQRSKLTKSQENQNPKNTTLQNTGSQKAYRQLFSQISNLVFPTRYTRSTKSRISILFRFLPLFISAIIMAGAIITAYLRYIPTAEKAAARAPILLDSLKTPPQQP